MAREGLGNLLSTQEEGFPRQTRGFSRSMRTSTPSCRSHLPKRLAVGDPNKLFHGQFEVKPLLQARRGLTGIQVFSTRREKQPALIFVFGFTSNITKSSKEKYVGWDGMGQQVLMGATLRELASRRLCTNYGTPHIPSKPKQQGISKGTGGKMEALLSVIKTLAMLLPSEWFVFFRAGFLCLSLMRCALSNAFLNFLTAFIAYWEVSFDFYFSSNAYI